MCLVGPTPVSLLFSGGLAQLASVAVTLTLDAFIALIGFWALIHAASVGRVSPSVLKEASDA
jgi:hypothetical protein